MNFFDRPEFCIARNTKFLKLDVFPSSGERMETPSLLGPLERPDLNLLTY
jgi:hypothetical protein